MAISSAPLSHIMSYATSQVSSLTSSGINTTGANFLVVGVVFAIASSPTLSVTDSVGGYSNTYTALDLCVGSSGSGAQLFVCYNPTYVGSGHTFTASTTYSGGDYLTLFASCWSGVAASPLDQQNFNNTYSAGMTETCGSITPGQSGELVLTVVDVNTQGGGTASTISSGLTVLDQQNDSSGQAGAIAYLVGPTSGQGLNPTWTYNGTGAGYLLACIASFEAATGGGSNMVQLEVWWKRTAYNQ